MLIQILFTKINHWFTRRYCGVEVDTWSCGVILYTLVAGFLPFDEELMPALFKKIREADYYIPSTVSHRAADLIHRMLQADPVDRIKFEMIKKHPWLSDTTPLFLQISLENARSWFSSKVDEEVFRRVTQMPFHFQNFREEQIRESIMRRKDYSFVIGYDLMVNEKIKAQISATKSITVRSVNGSPLIFFWKVICEKKSIVNLIVCCRKRHYIIDVLE